MAADSTPSFDDLDPVANDFDDDDVPEVKLQPGETIVAEVRHIEKNKSRYNNDLVHLTVRDYDGDLEEGDLGKLWASASVSDAFEQEDVGPGDVFGVRKSTDQYTYEVENDDGETEEREAYSFDVRVLGDA